MTCIFKKNYFSGFISEHKRLCAYTDCGEDSTFHVHTTAWCANMCRSHKDKFLKTHPKAEVAEEIYLDDRSEVMAKGRST